MSTLVAEAHVIATRWMERSPESYRRATSARGADRFVVSIHLTKNGEYFVRAVSGNPTELWAHTSEPFSDVDSCRQEANLIWSYIRNEFMSEFGYPDLTDPRKTVGSWRASNLNACKTYCSRCEHFDCLKLDQQAYGDLTTCTTPGCDYSNYYSIGD